MPSSEPLNEEGCQRLLRAIFGAHDQPAIPRCPACGGLCIGGCYKCGAGPICQVIDDDTLICKECGTYQGDETDTPMEELVRRDLRAIRGIHAV